MGTEDCERVVSLVYVYETAHGLARTQQSSEDGAVPRTGVSGMYAEADLDCPCGMASAERTSTWAGVERLASLT